MKQSWKLTASANNHYAWELKETTRNTTKDQAKDKESDTNHL